MMVGWYSCESTAAEWFAFIVSTSSRLQAHIQRAMNLLVHFGVFAYRRSRNGDTGRCKTCRRGELLVLVTATSEKVTLWGTGYFGSVMKRGGAGMLTSCY